MSICQISTETDLASLPQVSDFFAAEMSVTCRRQRLA